MASSIVGYGSVLRRFRSVSYRFKTVLNAVRNYRLLLSPSLYWDELSALNWWLLWSDEATVMTERVSAEYDKYLALAELGCFSSRHEELLDAFLGHGLLGYPRPQRPG